MAPELEQKVGSEDEDVDSVQAEENSRRKYQ
jgi:hypothetical protein